MRDSERHQPSEANRPPCPGPCDAGPVERGTSPAPLLPHRRFALHSTRPASYERNEQHDRLPDRPPGACGTPADGRGHVSIDAEDAERVESTRIDHVDNGETSDLWVIEGGRLTHHLDLRPLIDVPDVFDPEDDEGRIDRQAFDAAVPATLRGPLLRRGEELRLLDVRRDFASTESDLPVLYPDQPLAFGMSLWMNSEVTDEPATYFTDPDSG